MAGKIKGKSDRESGKKKKQENGKGGGEIEERRRKNYHLKKCRKIVAVAFCTHHWGSMECAHTDTKCRRVVLKMLVCVCRCSCVCACVGHKTKSLHELNSYRLRFVFCLRIGNCSFLWRIRAAASK